MPMIKVKYATPAAGSVLKNGIAAAVSKLSVEILHKDPAVTAVLVEEAAAADWYCGGVSLAESNLAAFWLDIRITDGTNTKDEKASFVAAVFKKMAELLGSLHSESYVHVHDVRADAYGFGGLTQERRYIERQLSSCQRDAV
jgi:4-oxalocrotonate tautomerase